MAKIKIGQKFEWDTEDLPAYIDQTSDELRTRLVDQARSVRLMQTLEDIKGSQELQLLNTDIVWQSGASCGFNPSGDSKLTQKTITVADIKVEKEFCNKDLVGLWTQTKLKRGASAELADLPFEQVILDNILMQNALLVDQAIWLGDTTSLNPNLNRFNGFVKQIISDATVIDMNTGGYVSITNSNALAVFRSAFAAMPGKLTSDIRFGMFAGYETIQKLIANMIDLNMYHFNPEQSVGNLQTLDYIVIPGTMCKVWMVPGLNGTSHIFSGLIGMNGEYLVGTDTESDWTKIESGYDARLQSLWYRLQFRLGVSFPFGNQLGAFYIYGS